MSISRLQWRLLPRLRKEALLNSMPVLERRQFEKLMKGRTTLPQSFMRLKMIYVHVPKVAGKSICDFLFDGERLGHMPYCWYEKNAPNLCGQYFRFSFVRNPWDRMVSAYHYLRSGGSGKRDKEISKELSVFKTFDDFAVSWLNEKKLEEKIHFVPQYEFLKNHEGLVDLDFIGRFENLSRDVEKLCCQLGRDKVHLNKLKKINASKRGDYRQYYTETSREIVAELYKKDITMFGYSF